ncbi:aromatic amino acid DMT transporter YddG [Myxococcota bacterium]|nr:aromatic amino acid DMT transporter YddG [Myxococcota bacterium]MBU1412590.1 aromatic amino acid DMT transporter YddG [Myxococcota bacterium]MBU1510650.1 aromatic amino acid DMT transporter YddG [Myxococcota bacterium]
MTPSAFAPDKTATWQGVLAILLWSLTLGLSRSLIERVGPLTAAVAVYLVAGGVSLARLAARGRIRRPYEPGGAWRFLLCGALFVGYMLALYLAVGGAVSREQALEVGLLNYLWPVLTLLGTVLFLGRKARGVRLVVGTLLALAGIMLTLAPSGAVPFADAARAPLVPVLGLAAAVAWAAYSILVRRFAEGSDPAWDTTGAGAVAWYLVAVALTLLVPALLADEPRAFSLAALAEIALLGLSTSVAYAFWERAMSHGRVTVVVAFSYLTPLLSTLFSAAYLAVLPPASLQLGCVLLIAGSITSWSSVSENR